MCHDWHILEFLVAFSLSCITSSPKYYYPIFGFSICQLHLHGWTPSWGPRLDSINYVMSYMQSGLGSNALQTKHLFPFASLPFQRTEQQVDCLWILNSCISWNLPLHFYLRNRKMRIRNPPTSWWQHGSKTPSATAVCWIGPESWPVICCFLPSGTSEHRK